MAKESVKVVPQAITDHYSESDATEAVDAALSAALAVSTIIADVTTGDNANIWTSYVVDDLHTAQRIILREAKSRLRDLRHENWNALALLGEYGPEAKARVEAEKAAEEVGA